jgi:transcriptional regulator with XRE-family HTH domain
MTVEEQLQRVREMLTALIRVSPYTQTEIERQLGLGRGHLSQRLRGKARLDLRLVLSILELIEEEPCEFFNVALPPRRPGRFAEGLARMF